MKFYSYCVKNDVGAAPNPFWSICTLVICKPAIRRTAEIGDWIVGLGSTNSRIGNISDSVVYAMKVTDKKTMEQYDQYCRAQMPRKIPNWTSSDYRDRAGDCIYDFTAKTLPVVRESIHSVDNREKDLSGQFALLSEHFYYFGDRPVQLPPDLKAIVHPSPSHKVKMNEPFAVPFIEWMGKFRLNHLYGEPQLKDDLLLDTEKIVCGKRDLENDDEEGIC